MDRRLHAPMLIVAQISAAMKRACRCRNIVVKATKIAACLQTEQLGQPEPVTAAYTAGVRAEVAPRVLGEISDEGDRRLEQHQRALWSPSTCGRGFVSG